MKSRLIDALLVAGLLLCASALRVRAADELPAVERLAVVSGKTHLLDMPVNIERVSISAPETAEAVPVSARSLMVNGKLTGETSLVIWLSDGSRREFDVAVTPSSTRIDVANRELQEEFGGDVHLAFDSGSAYLTGKVKNLYAAGRAESIAATMGRVVDLLKVDVPDREEQILLKVRFADVDRSKSSDLGVNFFGAPLGYPLSATTGQYSASTVTGLASAGSSSSSQFSLSDALNLFLFDPHLNLGATIKALQNQNILQILAEPNVLAMNGHEASFVSGGEFPYPTLNGGGSGVGQITIQFREFGVRIHFLPTITPRGTIRLHVTPEVSSLDYSNALSVSGFTVPALSTRRVDTEVELENGQSFAIAGLLDNQTTESLSRIPGLASIPLFGKLFTSRSTSKTNSELLVIITPELVAPIPEGQALPDLPRPTPFLEGPGIISRPPQTPGVGETGPAPVKSPRREISVQEMEKLERDKQSETTATTRSLTMSTSSDPSAPGSSPASSPAGPAGLNPAGNTATVTGR